MSPLTLIQTRLPKWIKGVEERKTIKIYRLQGEIDAHAVTTLQKFSAFARNQKGYEYKHILLDFANVASIDSSAVAALIKELHIYKKMYQKFAIMNLAEGPNYMIRLAKVMHLFPSYESEEQAIQDLEARF